MFCELSKLMPTQIKKRSICTQNAASCEGASTHDVRSLHSMSHPDGPNQLERS